MLHIWQYAFNYNETLTNVYYTGTAEEWNSITIEGNNNILKEDAIYYYSEEAPTVEGNYWHYDTDGITPVKW